MSALASLLGKNGMIGAIGFMFFLFVYKYSGGIFEYIEKQTLGTRTHVTDRLDLCFIDFIKV